MKKIALAYSGGLDTSVILKWLQLNYNCPVATYTADIGQNEDFGSIEEKARKLGLQKLEAKVLTNNSSSKKIFEKNNFKHKLDYLEKIL